MRKLAIFILSLPLLAFAIILIPIGLLISVIASPMWLILSLIALLKGDDPMWGIILQPPFLGVSLYAETTGLIHDPLRW